MSDWQVVDTLQKKKEKLKQKHAENAIEAAAREKQRLLDQQEKDAELKRLGLGFTITDVSTQHYKQPKKGKKGQGKSKQINAIYDLHIPSDDEGQKKKVKADKNKDKQKKPKEPKEPKERKDKSNLAEACAGLDADTLKTELKKIEIEYSSLPGVQLPKLAELLENSFPKVQPFNKHVDGHLYKRIQSPLRTFQENNSEVFTLILNWIGDRPVSGDFVTLLVDHLVDPHGHQGIGIRILLSILARYHAQRIVGESQYIIDRLPFRTATWIFLQTMYSDPDLALLLWVRHMLPKYLDDEKENTEAVVYLACLFTYIRKKGHRVHVPMPEGEFAALLGQFLVARATSPETNFNLIKDHYYELLDTSFITPKDPTKLFEELLELSTSSDSNVSNAAVDVLIYNLKANTELFKIWKEIYAEHVVETNNLLVFIRRNYEHIQTSMLPPIVREAHTYASDVSSDDREDDEEQDKKKKNKKGVLGASMELNGKTLHHPSSSSPSLSSPSSSSSSRKTHARSTPISVRELQLLVTRIEEINKELADVKRPKGKKAKEEAGNTKRVGKDTLNVCNATCQELRETMTQSKSGRERENSAVGTCVKGLIGVAGLIGVVGLAFQYVYGYEALEQFLYNAK